jgi:hypothetical protein
MAGPHDVRSVIAGITSESESARKLSAYHLQSLVSEPAFAHAFVKAQGVPALKQVVLEDNGNALAYALGSLTRLLEMDLGWDRLSSDVIERVRNQLSTSPYEEQVLRIFGVFRIGCPSCRQPPCYQCPSQRVAPPGSGGITTFQSVQATAPFRR